MTSRHNSTLPSRSAGAALLSGLGFSLLLGLSPSAHALDAVSVQLDWLPAGDKAFVYAGVAEGFYRDAGLEVTIRPGRGSADAVTQLAAGNADVGTAGIGSLMQAAAEGGVPVKAVMSIYSKPPDAIFTVEGSGITDLESAVGKRLAMPTFSSSNALWPAVLERNGIAPDSIPVINTDPSGMAPLLAQGRVDMTLNWVTKAPESESVLAQAGKQLQVLPLSDFGLEGYGFSLMASERTIEQRPEVLRRFVEASRRAIEFSSAHPDQAAAAVKAAVPEADLAVLEGELRNSLPLIDNEISARDGFGAFDPALLSTTWEWIADSMDFDRDALDPASLVDTRFLGAEQ
ncbi:ABC transporter substrate-binding protein [Halotalea alkalilenta]|uniref:ABC transporter substrate-binding protein n=1 Tax=Halotalea alkalilenta TaxID=376489 RepID=UPI00069336A2|nr:ABC transporter substrate-binding protein [Halotalea alkalilenta]